MTLPIDKILSLVGEQTNQQKTKIYNEAARLITVADHFYKPTKGLIIPEFRYDLKGRTAGMACARYKAQEFYIRLNNDALLNPEFKDYIFEQTLPHEIAHTVVQQLWPTNPSHGYKWAEVMHLFNRPANRTHNLPLKKARKTRRFEYATKSGCCMKCNCGLNVHNKIQAGRIYKCTRHGDTLDINFWREVT